MALRTQNSLAPSSGQPQPPLPPPPRYLIRIHSAPDPRARLDRGPRVLQIYLGQMGQDCTDTLMIGSSELGVTLARSLARRPAKS